MTKELVKSDGNPSDIDTTQIAQGAGISSNLALVARDRGVDLSSIIVPRIENYEKIAWEDLCTLRTKNPKVMVSPQLLVMAVYDQPEAEQIYKDYVGMVRAEIVTEWEDEYYVTHARTYADTGEFLPLSQWLLHIQPPVPCRFGRIATSRERQYVIKPVPCSIEVES